MASELIFRGHESQHERDTYSPKPEKQTWHTMTRPIHYLLREQRLVFLLVGAALAFAVVSLLSPSAGSSYSASSAGAGAARESFSGESFLTAESTRVTRRVESGGAFRSGKAPLGLKRRGLRIVVTGGAGFVGSHLVDRLIARGDSVIVVDNLFTGRKENVMHHFGNPRFELIRHDVVEPLLLEVDHIYHLACPASPVHYKHNPVKTIISFFFVFID
ncbi:hypothetical protein vseg_020622 [Gypsophila vaccaria]